MAKVDGQEKKKHCSQFYFVTCISAWNSGGRGNWHLGGGGKSGSIPVLAAKVVVVFL